MKLFRTNLDQGISAQLFERSTESLDVAGLEIQGDTISLELSSEKTSHGYRVTGTVDLTVKETCDRCLKQYPEQHSSNLDIVLTEDPSLIDEKNVDVLWFPGSEDSIDISPILNDLILLEEPFKKLCQESCKGLCSNCGTDLNLKSCSCSEEKSDSPWETLKSVTNK